MRGRPVTPQEREGRAGGSGLQPAPREDRACWATLGEPSLPLPQFPGSVALPWARGAWVPSAWPAGAAGEVRVCEVLRGCVTSVQGLLNKVGVFTCSCYLLSSLKSQIC